MIPPLFNPSNDMALASGLARYTPPPRIQHMEHDLASLSRFWDEGPWGWSLATRTRYLDMGVPASLLPSDQWLARHRRLSSRAFAYDYLARLLDCLSDPRLVGHEMRFVNEDETLRYGNENEDENQEETLRYENSNALSPNALSPTAPLIFKSPWSSSGRGLAVAPHGVTPEVRSHLRGFVRRQGGFLVDRYYANKQVDFAMEFHVHGPDDVEFLGYSLFLTDSRGAYRGNLLASQSQLQCLTAADEGLLSTLRDYHLRSLGRLDYRGPLGIDMMTLSDGRLHPVVEINLRRTMGSLALTLFRQGITSPCALTPALSGNGFQAVVSHGLLRITYRS